MREVDFAKQNTEGENENGVSIGFFSPLVFKNDSSIVRESQK
jgi:hypothetical protein